MPGKTTEKNVFLFCGKDTFSCFYKLNLWKSEFIKKHGETNIDQIEASDLSAGKLAMDIGSVPFLSEKRLIIIKNFLERAKSDEQKEVAEVIENVPDSCILVFYEDREPDKRTSLYQKISKTGKVVEFPVLSPKETVAKILEKAKADNINIKPFTADYLATYLALDLWSITNELNKLKTFADGKEITKEMVDDLVTPSLSSSIFKLTDALAARNSKESIRILRTLIEMDEELNMIFFMIVRHFRLMIQIKELVEKKDPPYSIAKQLGANPYVVQIISKQCRNFTEENLRDIYQKLLKIDIDVKTGNIRTTKNDISEFELAIEKLIIECCNI
ncbi:MAG: DNA polymerase III subunit delta [Candidatus Gracilibacteria bacterium]